MKKVTLKVTVVELERLMDGLSWKLEAVRVNPDASPALTRDLVQLRARLRGLITIANKGNWGISS